MRDVCMLLGFVLLVSSCSPVSHRALTRAFKETESRFQDHTGFMLYDPANRKVLFEHHADRYFTPASNTKIFTLFASLHILGDSVPALRYSTRGDSLIVWGTGDPSFLYKNVHDNGRVYRFLRAAEKPVYFSPANFHTPYFGPGWSWEDYDHTYSSERSPFPVYGNTFEVTKTDTAFTANPSYFDQFIVVSADSAKKEKLVRSPVSNHVTYYPARSGNNTIAWTKPFKTDAALVATLLTDTLRREVTPVHIPLDSSARTLYSIPADSLYKVMMQESDNFIAEQLLLVCAGVLADSLKTEITIDYVKENFLHDLPDRPLWVDGSGLSRYNLFTPRAVVKLWEKIYALVPRERLFQIVAIGGKAGTIENSYKAEKPYIYGKTGTLSNVHCLSGYLITKKGKTLIFSFMNTNYATPVREVRHRMEEMLRLIHTNY